MARGLVYTVNEFDMMRKNPRFGFTMDKAKDNKKYAGNFDRKYADIVPGEYETFVNNTPLWIATWKETFVVEERTLKAKQVGTV